MSSKTIDTRVRVLRAARHLLEESDRSPVSLEQVAKAAGVSRQAVYLHFGSRAGLLLALVQFVDEEEGLAALAKPIWEAPTGAEAIAALARLNATYSPRIYAVAIACQDLRNSDADVAAALDDRQEHRLANCRQLAARLEVDGSLSPELTIDAAADLIFVLTSMAVWEQFVIQRSWTATEYQTQLYKLLVASLTHAQR